MLILKHQPTSKLQINGQNSQPNPPTPLPSPPKKKILFNSASIARRLKTPAKPGLLTRRSYLNGRSVNIITKQRKRAKKNRLCTRGGKIKYQIKPQETRITESFDFEMGLFIRQMPSAVTYVKINATFREQTLRRNWAFQGSSSSVHHALTLSRCLRVGANCIRSPL